MKKYFPIPYPDELLYSVISRFCNHLGLDNTEGILYYLYGSKSLQPIIDLPNRIGHLVESTPLALIYNAEKIALEHTMFPYYMAFIGKKRRDNLLKAMLGDGQTKVFGQFGNFARHVSTNFSLRFCPKCIEDDIRTYGEPYWHRIHQVPEIKACPHHHVLIRESCSTCGSKFLNKKRGFFNLDEKCCNGHNICIQSESVVEKKCVDYAEDAWELLNSTKIYELEQLDTIFDTRLKEMGYASFRGTVKQSQLKDDFIQSYGSDYLSDIGCDIDDSDGNWFFRLFRRGKSCQHPLRYLLVIRFLFGSFKNFESGNRLFTPFGFGPWPCLNPVADHYKESVVTSCKLGVKDGFTIGIFRCSCGYAYAVRLDETGIKNEWKISKIMSLGRLFEKKVTELLSNQLSPGEIAYRLKCNVESIYYIQKKAAKKQKKESSIVREKQQPYREVILSLRRKPQNLTRVEIRKLAPKEYAWLFYYDREWLMSNLPEKQKIENKVKVDWGRRDEEYSRQLNDFIVKTLNETTKPERLTKIKFMTMLNFPHRFTKNKLPKTSEIMERFTETFDSYRVRCIKWAATMIRQNGEEVTESKIRKLLSLSVKLSPQVQEVLDSLLD